MIRPRRKAIIHKDTEALNENGEVDEKDLHLDYVTTRCVWIIYRVSFEKYQEIWSDLDVSLGEEGDESLQEVRRESL